MNKERGFLTTASSMVVWAKPEWWGVLAMCSARWREPYRESVSVHSSNDSSPSKNTSWRDTAGFLQRIRWKCVSEKADPEAGFSFQCVPIYNNLLQQKSLLQDDCCGDIKAQMSAFFMLHCRRRHKETNKSKRNFLRSPLQIKHMEQSRQKIYKNLI